MPTCRCANKTTAAGHDALCRKKRCKRSGQVPFGSSVVAEPKPLTSGAKANTYLGRLVLTNRESDD